MQYQSSSLREYVPYPRGTSTPPGSLHSPDADETRKCDIQQRDYEHGCQISHRMQSTDSYKPTPHPIFTTVPYSFSSPSPIPIVSYTWRSSITYFPDGFRSARNGVLSEMRCHPTNTCTTWRIEGQEGVNYVTCVRGEVSRDPICSCYQPYNLPILGMCHKTIYRTRTGGKGRTWKSSRSRGTLTARAMAMRCSTALVDPPRTITSVIAFSNAYVSQQGNQLILGRKACKIEVIYFIVEICNESTRESVNCSLE